MIGAVILGALIGMVAVILLDIVDYLVEEHQEAKRAKAL